MTDRISVLPPRLLTALLRIGERLQSRSSVEPFLAEIFAPLFELPPERIVRAEREIVEAASLYEWPQNGLWFKTPFRRRYTTLEQLARLPGLEYLFLFHRYGYVREAALRKISGPLPSAFIFAAIVWRLNDWVEPVRAAAVECARRCFPITSANAVTEAAIPLLERHHSWGRWRAERELLWLAIARSDVAIQLADLIVKSEKGPTAKVLRFALKADVFDPYLLPMMQSASQPAVRAVAARTLIDGLAIWQEGWEWQWVDKSLGLRRRVPALAQRKITVAVEREQIVAFCIRDKSALVRKVAIAGAIRHGLGSAETLQLAQSLKNDPSRAVRERAEFVLNHKF